MKKVKEKLIIKGIDLLIHSSGKEGKHLPQVYSGTGVHKSIKDYKRKKKHKKKYSESED